MKRQGSASKDSVDVSLTGWAGEALASTLSVLRDLCINKRGDEQCRGYQSSRKFQHHEMKEVDTELSLFMAQVL